MLADRDYSIDDDGDEVQLALFENGVQVGGAMFPDDGDGLALGLALDLASMWSPKAAARCLH